MSKRFTKEQRTNLVWSLAIHGVFVLVLLLPGWFTSSKPPPEMLEFTIVLPPPPEEEAPPTETVKQQIAPPPVPVKDALVVEKQKPKQPPQKKLEPPKKKPEPKKEEPKKKPEPKKEEPKKKPFQKGKRIEAPKTPPEPKMDFTKLRKAVLTPTEKPLSAKEIQDALAKGAKVGTRNQIPDNERDRCFALIQQALTDNWEQPSLSEAGNAQPVLEIRLDRSGRILASKLVQSSGNPRCDQSVLLAAKNTNSIRGLSAEFLRQNPVVQIGFSVR